MAAQTFTGTRAAAGFPVYSNHVGNLRVAYGTFTLTEVPEVGDIWTLCKLPRGAKPVGGYFALTDIDTGTETLDIDLGYAANGVDAADSDAFCNAGVLSGDQITDRPLTNAANLREIVFTTILELGAETTVQAQCIAVANAGGTGTMACVIYYTMD